MSLIKFSDFDEESLSFDEDVVIVEWAESEWLKLLNYERAELEAEEEECLREFKARNTQQRRATQKNKDRNKFKDRQGKLKAKIDRKKGGNKVRRLKIRKKWQKVNKSKIKNAQKVYGGKVKSKFTKTNPAHKRGGR
jgi:hypothetical protein|tara:strand:- start:1141 stop:1551 length:411 start_codon:yes stop_codon:yes gene_type:complete